MTKIKYTDEHIDDLIDRLNLYEQAFKDEDGRLRKKYYLKCKVCPRPERRDCSNCLLSVMAETPVCHEGQPARAWLEGHVDTEYCKPAAINWYHTMIERTNANLERTGNKWRIEPGKNIK